MCGQHSPTQADFVPVMQYPVDLHRFEVSVAISAVLEISLATGLNNIHVAVHDVILRASEFLHQRTARAVVPMRMTDEQNLSVAEVKPKFLNALANHGNRTFQTAVDKNVPLRSGDQVGSQSLTSYVINITDH